MIDPDPQPNPLPDELTEERTRPPHTQAVLRAFLVVTTVDVLVLLVSGLWLAGFYLPREDDSAQDLIEQVHIVSAWLLVPLILVLFVIALLPTAKASPILPVVTGVFIIIGLATAGQVVWDGIELEVAKIGAKFEGMRWVLERRSPVGSVQVDGESIPLNSFRAWFGTHVGAGLMVLALVAGARWGRNRTHVAPKPQPWITNKRRR